MEEDNKKHSFEMAMAVAITVLIWSIAFKIIL